jgi:hypothetical protein
MICSQLIVEIMLLSDKQLEMLDGKSQKVCSFAFFQPLIFYHIKNRKITFANYDKNG